VGQAFVAIGLAMGILAACGGPLPRARRLPPAALVLAPGDTAVSPVAGLTGIAGRLWLWSLRVLRPAAIALAMGRGLP
jgi:SNF family Na+-dependent transporter